MADEAFALSPISARAALPGEEDYAAISEAFMETSRGRWFLGEYAKRNRNADTRMVLDAVARIEQSLAAQKEESLAIQREAANAQLAAANAQKAAADAQREAAEAVADNSLAEARLVEALIAIRGAFEIAQISAMGAIDELALNEKLAPVRKGARVIREIAWRLREIGNDGRICDLIDSQVQVIEKGADQITSDDARTTLEAAFALLAGRIADFSEEEPAAPADAPVAEAPVIETPIAETPAAEKPVAETPVAEAPVVETQATDVHVAAPAPVAQDEAPVAEIAEQVPASEAQAPPPPVSTADATAPATDAAIAPTVVAEPEPPVGEMETAAIESTEVDALTAEATDADDEALLDMIAMEMGAPEDPIDDDEIVEAAIEQARIAEPVVEEAQIAEPAAVEPEAIPELPEPMAAPIEPPLVQSAPPPPPVAETTPQPAPEISLGSSIIASGIVKKPVAANDPLAPIRRMSQAEKIAFFS